MSTHQQKSGLATLAIGALGIVYGDIGTSPLYAVKECFHGPHAVAATPGNVLGVLSLIIWSLIVVVSIKYIGFIMRADNRGEGGIFALFALIPPGQRGFGKRIQPVVVLAALLGAALLYGDGVITPAVSVLSAVEGLGVATSRAEPYVIPLTCVILLGLFAAQKFGTGGIGRIFGPIMTLWFLVIGGLGLMHAVQHPQVLAAVLPTHAISFFAENRFHGFVVLGSVFLSVTGGEALYADMGHFGRHPIRVSWFGLVLPALLLNYFGQAALLLSQPHHAESPFYGLVPELLLYPMVALSTLATVIASQALISGAFSLTRQAVQLGYLPRVQIIHTSAHTEGQIYVPGVNWALMVATIGLVVAFGSSSRLAAAYGIAVTATMGITSVLYYFVVRRVWNWPKWKALGLMCAFLVFDLAFFSSNLLKFFNGGWVPILIAVLIMVLMTTWYAGRQEIRRILTQSVLPLDLFLPDLRKHPLHRIPGTAIFMTSSPVGTPPVLLHHIRHNQVLHETVILLSMQSSDVPKVDPHERLKHEALGEGFHRLTAYYGYMETPNVLEVLEEAKHLGLNTEPGTTTYYLGRESLRLTGHSRLMRWRKRLFALMSRNARDASAYFDIPPRRAVELGMLIEL